MTQTLLLVFKCLALVNITFIYIAPFSKQTYEELVKSFGKHLRWGLARFLLLRCEMYIHNTHIVNYTVIEFYFNMQKVKLLKNFMVIE